MVAYTARGCYGATCGAALTVAGQSMHRTVHAGAFEIPSVNPGDPARLMTV